MAEAHIPAWKRLGLKLKYAKETSLEPSSSTANNIGGPRKTKFDDTDISSGLKTNDVTPPKKRKRVSFSSDTKVVDGDTARSALPSEVRDALAQARAARTSPPKRPKPTPTPSKHKSKDALDYLHQYYYAHSTWKYNTNRQTWILKHTLDTSNIPPKYNLPLAQYLHGLKSQNSRDRLSTEASAWLSSNLDVSAGPLQDEHNLGAFTDALKAFPEHTLTEDDPTTKLVNGHHRDEVVLLALANNNDTSVVTLREASKTKNKELAIEAAEAKRYAAAKQKKKTKKSRTIVAEESSSSGESSNESESEGATSSEGEEDTSSDGSESEDDSDMGVNGDVPAINGNTPPTKQNGVLDDSEDGEDED